MNTERSVNMMDSLNENWTNCQISDDERLDRLEKLFPNSFRKQALLDSIAEAAKSLAPSRVKADKAVLFGEQSKAKAVTPDVCAKPAPTLNVPRNNKV